MWQMQQLPQAGQGRADNAQRLLNEALLQEQQALLREQQGLLEAADQRLLNEALLREQKSEAMYKGLLEAADRESKVRIDTLTRQNAGLTEQLKQAVKVCARVLALHALPAPFSVVFGHCSALCESALNTHNHTHTHTHTHTHQAASDARVLTDRAMSDRLRLSARPTSPISTLTHPRLRIFFSVIVFSCTRPCH